MDRFFPEQPQVLYVGTRSTQAARLGAWLQGLCRPRFLAPQFALNLQLADEEEQPKLIFLDASLSEAGQICVRLRQNPATMHLPVIALGAEEGEQREIEMLDSGACDYIREPVARALFLARVRSHVLQNFSTEAARSLRTYLQYEVARRSVEISRSQEVTLQAMSALAGMRDNSTGKHILRTQYYVRALARHLSAHPSFSSKLTPHYVDLLFQSAPLHDIGKVGIPDHILLKPGRLTPEEMDVMKTHPLLGLLALENAERQLGRKVEYFAVAKDIAYCHHERWDGTGYPMGLKGSAIPIAARLMAVADVYDAIVSRRVYKDEMPHSKAVDVIIEGNGSHFDPDVVHAFVEIEDEFRCIAERYADNNGGGDVPPSLPRSGMSKPGDPLLSALQERVDSLSGDAAPFVVAILKETSSVPRPLAAMIVRMLGSRGLGKLGPVHEALVQMFTSARNPTPDVEVQRTASLALLGACRSSKSANDALRFVMELPSLLRFTSQERSSP